MAAEAPHIGGQHFIHAGGGDAEGGEGPLVLLGLVGDDIVDAEQFHLIGGDERLEGQDAEQGGHDLHQPGRNRHQQAVATGLAQDALHQRLVRLCIGATQFIDAAGLDHAFGSGGDGIGHVTHKDGLEQGLAGNQRHDRQDAGQRAHEVEEAVALTEHQ